MADNKPHKPHEREITLEDSDISEDEFDSIAGEEDPGSALEDLVEYDKTAPQKPEKSSGK